MDAAIRFAILGAAQDKRVHRIMRRIALDTVRACRVSTRYASAGVAVPAEGNKPEELVLSWINTDKGGDYGKVLALYVANLVQGNLKAYAALECSLSKYAASAPASELVALPESLVAFLPEAVATKLMSIAGGIGESWLSLTDEEAATVVLSRPVVESDAQKAIESVVVALQSAARAYDIEEASPTCKALVALLATPSANTILTMGTSIKDDVVAAAKETDGPSQDLIVIADAIVTVITAQTPNARSAMHDMVLRFLGQLRAPQAGTAKSRFLRVLRSAYSGDDIGRAFLAQNVVVNTKALDVDRIQKVLSKNNLGALASAFLVKRDIGLAWDTMNLRGYFELLRWAPFHEVAADMEGGNQNRLAKLLVGAIVRMNDKDIREVIVRGSLASELITHLLTIPTGEDYGMSDIRTTKDATVKDLVYRLIVCANLARSNDTVVDAMLVEYTNLMASAAITPDQATRLRRICDACYPKDECLKFLEGQFS